MKSSGQIRILIAICLLGFNSLQTPAQPTPVLYPINEGGKFGYIDEQGRVVIKPQFDDAKSFSEGLARVKMGRKWGFINQAGVLVMPPQFEGSEANHRGLDFHEGMAAVSLDGRKWGYVDRSGQIVIQPKYDHADRFSEGIALVRSDYSERVGNETIIYIGGVGKYIDKRGNVISVPVVGGTFSEGLAVAEIPRKRPQVEQTSSDNPKVGYIDKTGRFRIQPRTWVPYQFSEGLARVRAGDQDHWGYINHAGRVVIKMKFAGAGDFHEGLARVGFGTMNFISQTGASGTMGFINKTGALAFRTQFAFVGNFSGGLASACVEDKGFAYHFKCGYIDKTGKWAIEPAFIFLLGDFKGELALACTSEKCGYINRSGKFVWAAPMEPDGNNPETVASPRAGCSIMSDKPDRNYPCTIDFKLF
ncbi:MAG TPA: WG repeat-containing protein [Pyrinomonadaceae bacterium]|nr:WG repeat-containing protein [Pyrinomonadaceae bacterium]